MVRPYVERVHIGDTFGRWTVVQPPKSDGTRYRCLCKCKCGKVKNVRQDILFDGGSLSCGCLTKEINAKKQFKHGLSRNKIQRIYHGMKDRCYKINHPSYKNYGGRGIYICDRWLESVANFYADMGECPSGMSIERIDNNGPYSPDNCKWATPFEQSNNKSNNRLITYNGETHNVSQWARIKGMRPLSLLQRLYDGWSEERALTEPVNEHS